MAIFLPRRWRHQPHGPVEIDLNHPIGEKIRWVHAPWLGPQTIIASDKHRHLYESPVTSTHSDYANAIASTHHGIGVRVLRTGAYAGEGPYYQNDTNVATLSTGSAVFGIVENLQRVDSSQNLQFWRFSTSDSMQLSLSGVPSLYLFSFTAWTASELIIPNGFSGIVALSAKNRKDFEVHFGDQYENGSSGAYSIRNFSGLRSSTGRWPNAVWPIVGRADYLTPDEVRELARNPWQIFRAPSHRIWFDLGASPTGTQAKVWNGTAWETHPIKVFMGGSWTPAKLKKHNGSSWEQI